ncbi:MAG: hypothetical protein EOM05_00170 [Clostridia bacterium]|nr:hypothetical protein [Clostridia bacterium]
MNISPENKKEDNKVETKKKFDFKNHKEKEPKKKYLESKDMNFFERYETVVEGKEQKINPMFFIVPAAGVLGVLILSFLFLNVMSVIKARSNKKVQEYINDSNNVASYNQSIQLSSEIAKRISSKDAIDEILETMKNYPSIDETFINALYSALPEGVTIEMITYNSSQGYFSMACSSTDVNAIPLFVNNLDSTGEFAFVSYTGYNGGTGGYAFTVDCICNGK